MKLFLFLIHYTKTIEDELQARLQQAANAIQDATALLFTSGAGLGVDSGLPDFRYSFNYDKEKKKRRKEEESTRTKIRDLYKN